MVSYFYKIYFPQLNLSLIIILTYIFNSSTIQAQNLTNIIKFKTKDLQYANFASYSNGDMILEICKYHEFYNDRFFYGFKNNGRGYFYNNKTNEEYYYHPIIVNSNSQQKYESENIVIKESGSGNEYLISIAKENTNVEIYDFNNNITYIKHINNFTEKEEVNSFRHTSIFLNTNTSNSYYYLFGFIGKKNNERSFIIQKHNFNSIKNFSSDRTLVKEISIRNMEPLMKESGVSCFQTEKKFILCFYLNNKSSYKIAAYDIELEEKVNITFSNGIAYISDHNPFYKCIFLKKEVGVFVFYAYKNDYYPSFLFKQYQENTSEIINFTISEIFLEKIIFNKYIKLNDIVKLNENKISFFSTIIFKLYITIINLFEDKYYKARYYLIDICKDYQFKIYYEMRLYNYNNFIAFGFSYNGDPEIGINNISVGLLIFNYPNATDKYLYLNKYLYNYSSIKNININLTDEVIIENNIFGYIFSSIEITDLVNCDNLIFFPSNSNRLFTPYNLTKNEIINLELTINNGDNFNNFTCILKYRYKVTEPDLEKYDEYPLYIQTSSNFRNTTLEKEEYIGRLTHYNIVLNETLTVFCNNSNCGLCFEKNTSFCIICKFNFTLFDDGTKNCSDNDNIITDLESINYSNNEIAINDIEIIKTEIKDNKEDLIEIIPKLINATETGKNYEMIGNDFILTIKPTNSFIPNSTNIDFSSCENILRDYYKIYPPRIITILQLEIYNKNEKSLVNNVAYQVYDDNKNILDLSLCNDTNIKIFYLIKSNSSTNISFLSSFKDLGIDLLNINDSFFNDICVSYSESNNDVVLNDRVIDYYQNYSMCDEGCTYNQSDLELMIIACDCEINENLTTNMTNTNLVQSDNIGKSSVFEIIKCYKLVFSFKDKLNNIGFWIISILLCLQIPLLIICVYKGIKPIKEYLHKLMVEYGYIKKNAVETNANAKNKKIKIKNKSSKEFESPKSPPKKKKSKKKILRENKNKVNDDSSIDRVKEPHNSKVLVQINNIINDNPMVNNNKNNNKKKKKKKRKKNIIVSLPTQGNKDITLVNKNVIGGNINLNLININLNNRSNNSNTTSNYVLNIYTFEEAINMDYRPLCNIFYIYLLTKQAVFHAFLYKSPLELFPLRFSLLIFIITSDLSLNALFYFDDKISDKYKYTKSLLLFSFSNNITVILLSTFIGFILLTLFSKLGSSINYLRYIFKSEEEKLKKDKKYKVTEKRKKEIQNEVEEIVKKYKIRTIILIIINLLLMIFFWYYVTAFCHVYSSTQMSWLWDSFLSMISRIIIDLLLSLLFAKLYRMAVESNIQCLYKASIFFYSFGFK